MFHRLYLFLILKRRRSDRSAPHANPPLLRAFPRGGRGPCAAGGSAQHRAHETAAPTECLGGHAFASGVVGDPRRARPHGGVGGGGPNANTGLGPRGPPDVVRWIPFLAKIAQAVAKHAHS